MLFAHLYYFVHLFASTYDCGTYGSSAYSSDKACGGSNSALANTGVAILTVLTIVCLLIFITLLVRFWRRKK